MVARAVLAEPQFARGVRASDVVPRRTLLEIVWDWFFGHVVQPLLAPLLHALAATRGLGTDVGIGLIVVALLAVGFVVVRLALAFVRPRAARGGPAGAEASAETVLDAGWWRQRARACAARGEYARAIAALWAAALALLDVREVVTFDPARTPGEYRRLVRRCGPRASEPFERLGESFVQAAYGPAAPHESDFTRAERALADFEPAL